MHRSFSTGSITAALHKNTGAVQLTETTHLIRNLLVTKVASNAQPPANVNEQNNGSAAPIYPAPPVVVIVNQESHYRPIACGKPSNLISSACAAGCGIGGGVIGYALCGLWGLFSTIGGAALGGYCGKETTRSCDPRNAEVVRMYRGN